MPVRVGYACIHTRLPSSNRTCRLDRATPDRILELARLNLINLAEILRWNLAHGITLFRISSEIIPFGSHPVNRLPCWKLLQTELEMVSSLKRFVQHFARLPDIVAWRLVVENDEKSYTLSDALEISEATGLPVVFDVFHHAWNPSFEGETLRTLVEKSAQTWADHDGPAKIHYSNQCPVKPPGSHSETVDVEAFGGF